MGDGLSPHSLTESWLFLLSAQKLQDILEQAPIGRRRYLLIFLERGPETAPSYSILFLL
jgi:hypothetical protein